MKPLKPPVNYVESSDGARSMQNFILLKAGPFRSYRSFEES